MLNPWLIQNSHYIPKIKTIKIFILTLQKFPSLLQILQLLKLHEKHLLSSYND